MGRAYADGSVYDPPVNDYGVTKRISGTEVFQLDQAGQDYANSRAADPANQISVEEFNNLPPGNWEGVSKAIGLAIPRAFADAARAGELAGSVAVGVAEPLLGYHQGELTDKYFSTVDPYVTNAVEYWTPRAASTGTAAKILGGVTEGLVQLGMGAGNPTVMLGSTVLNRSMDLADQGVNPDVAAAGGTMEGAATAAGLKIPFLGNSLLTRMASGAAGNLAIGRAATLAQKELLQYTGNEKVAEGYHPWDFSDATVEALTGLAYGGIAHLHSSVQPVEQDAALATLNAKHFQEDSAPGHPADIIASVAHQEALETAVRQTLDGAPVDVPPDTLDATFERRPFSSTPAEAGKSAPQSEPLFDRFMKAVAPGFVKMIQDRFPIDERFRANLSGSSLDPAPDGAENAGTKAPGDSISAALLEPTGSAPAPGVEPRDTSASSAESQARAPETRTPKVTGADHAVAAADFRVPTGETDAAGAPVTVSARALLKQSRDDVVRAHSDSQAFQAAANCLMAVGVHNAG